MAVVLNYIFLSVGHIAKYGKNNIPEGGANGGEYGKGQNFHVGKPCWNGYELAYNGNKPAYQCGYGTVFPKEGFGFFHLGAVKEKKMS